MLAGATAHDSRFTFHNVSINSIIDKHDCVVAGQFTFHNVSINSIHYLQPPILTYKFTFHNVSINSPIHLMPFLPLMYLHSIMYLLIHSIKILYAAGV